MRVEEEAPETFGALERLLGMTFNEMALSKQSSLLTNTTNQNQIWLLYSLRLYASLRKKFRIGVQSVCQRTWSTRSQRFNDYLFPLFPWEINLLGKGATLSTKDLIENGNAP